MDIKMTQRNRNFKSKVATKLDSRLSLRKKNLEDLIFEKRMKSSNPDNSEENKLKILIHELNIPPDLDHLYENSHDQQDILLKLLQDNDKEIVKFAIRKLSDMSFNLKTNDLGEIDLNDDIFDMLLFYLFEDENIKIIYEASNSLISITYVSSLHVKKLIQDETLNSLLNLTFHEKLPIVNNILWVFSNILCDEKEQLLEKVSIRKRIKDIFMNYSEIPRYLMTTIISLIRNIWIKGNDNDFNIHFAEIYLNKIITFLIDNRENKKEGDEFWIDSLSYIFHLTEIDEEGTYEHLKNCYFFDLIFKTNIAFSVIELYTIFRIIGNLFFSNDIIDKIFNDYDVISFINRFLDELNNSEYLMNTLAKELCFACSNIAGGPIKFKALLINSCIPEKVIKIIGMQTKLQTIREIVCFFYNLISGSTLELNTKLYDLKVFDFFCSCLNYEELDVIKYSVKGIELFLQYGDHIKIINNQEHNLIKREMEINGDHLLLEKHQYSNKKIIYETVSDILQNYFDEEKN